MVRHLLDECPVCVEQPQRVLAVGRKLCGRLDELLPGYEGMTSTCSSEEIPTVLTQVVAIQKQLVKHNSATLRIFYYNDELSSIRKIITESSI